MNTTQASPSSPSSKSSSSVLSLSAYLLAGIGFGIVAIKSEIISWYRIQEMFRLQSFHMYGVIASAVITAMLSVWLIKKFKPKSWQGGAISLSPKSGDYRRYIIGGVFFGLGWAMVGACPGPIFALIGSGYLSFMIVLLGALTGTWLYALLRPHLPH